MVSVYVRHQPPCQETDPQHKRCRCPKYVWGVPDCGGSFVRKSATTRSWEKAQRYANLLNSPAADTGTSSRISLSDAVTQYIESLVAQNRSSSYVQKIRCEFEKQFLSWASDHGLRDLSELDLTRVEQYRNGWTDSPLTKAKKQERLRSFFKYCVDHDWIEKNPALRLKRISHDPVQVVPFTAEEMERITAAAGMYGNGSKSPDAQWYTARMRAFVLAARWSGLRLGDLVSLQRSQLTSTDEIVRRTQKSKRDVRIPLPKNVAAALRALPAADASGQFFFWTTNGRLKSATSHWQRALGKVFSRAHVEDAHPHRFRHTFSVHLLEHGVPLEDVSELLGHSSVKVTAKFYSAWTKARQDRLASLVKKSWAAA